LLRDHAAIHLLPRPKDADPKILSGKAAFCGTRIPVHTVLELLASGVTTKDIISKDYYPQLSLKHIQAALSYSSYLLRNEETRSFATI